MNGDPFKLTIHLVASLDGVIAKKDNSVSWFETASYYEKGITVTPEDAEAFLKTIDCYVMGARTYEHALELSKTYGWPYGDLPTIVLSHNSLPVERPNVEIYNGGLDTLVSDRLKPKFGNVWVVGGAMVARDFIRQKLAHEIRLSVLPIILGDGLRFFDDTLPEQALSLEDVKAYKNGMLELIYTLKKAPAETGALPLM